MDKGKKKKNTFVLFIYHFIIRSSAIHIQIKFSPVEVNNRRLGYDGIKCEGGLQLNFFSFN